MKINKHNFISATAEAMSKEATVKLFKAEPVAFDMFTIFAFAVFTKLDGKDITDEDYADAVSTVIVDTLPDDITALSMTKDLALIIFSQHIWEELEKLDKSEKETSETDKFYSELKSAIDK